MKVVKAALALAGVAAVALYVVVALVIELIARLLPLIVLAAVVALIVYLWRRKGGTRKRQQALPAPGWADARDQPVLDPGIAARPQWVTAPQQPVPAVPTHRRHLILGATDAGDGHGDGYLRLGPSVDSPSPLQPHVVSGSRSRARRGDSRARPRSARP